MLIIVTHNGVIRANVEPAEAFAAGVPQAAIGAAIKARAKHDVAEFADGYPARLASRSAGKLAEYRIKEEIARDPASAGDAELALIDREAAARGFDRDVLIAQINTQAAAYRQIALLIGALEAEAGAAITAIPDDADDIETQIHTVLGAAKAQEEAAFVEAVALINGGS